MVLEEFVGPHIGDISTADESENFLSEIPIENKTAKVWIDC